MLGPFDDPAWRDDLSLLASSAQVDSLALYADCETLVALAERVPRTAGDERGGTPWTSFPREVAVVKHLSDRAAGAQVALAQALLRNHRVTAAALKATNAPVVRARLLVEECARYNDEVAREADRDLADRVERRPSVRRERAPRCAAWCCSRTTCATSSSTASPSTTLHRRSSPSSQPATRGAPSS